MSYDSEEEKDKQQRLAEALKNARELAKNKEGVEKLIQFIFEHAKPLIDKSKYEKLSFEEYERLIILLELAEKFSKNMMGATDILDYDRSLKAETQFFYLKKLAEEGNEDARKMYEELLPLFRNAQSEDFNSSERKN